MAKSSSVRKIPTKVTKTKMPPKAGKSVITARGK